MEELQQLLKTRVLALSPNVGLRIERHSNGVSQVIDHQADSIFEVGSCFKAFVAAELCRQGDAGTLSLEDQIVLRADDRVPGSVRFDDMPDGSIVTMDSAARAMIAVSDNTATDLVMKRLGHEKVMELVEGTGMERTITPQSVKSVDAIEEGALPIACHSSMTDLARFYAVALSGERFPNASTLDRFKESMREEDLEQKSACLEGVLCYRKSGSMEPPPLFVQAMAGAFIEGESTSVFAFVLNQFEQSEIDISEESEIFVDCLRTAMRTLAGNS